MKRSLALCSLIGFITYSAKSQIAIPSTPPPPSFQPVSTTKSPTHRPQITTVAPSSSAINFLGGTSDDIIRQVNDQASFMMGSLPPGIKEKKDAEREKEYQSLLAEIKQDERSYYSAMQSRRFGRISSKDFPSYKATFYQALTDLKRIVASTHPSVAQAIYLTESTFGRSWLSEAEFNKVLDQSASFIKSWLLQNGYKLSDNDALHLGIQKFISERLTIIQDQKTIVHEPFFYDYDDYTGDKDYSNTFLTKLLATGGGQCSSMPQAYLALAERLNAKAYLSFAPHHSFIKYLDDKGNIQNYEPTSNWHISDQWYEENMFISAEAIRTGIYLDTVNARQIIANSMLDLAVEYIRLMPAEDGGGFLKDCVVASAPYYPKDNNIFSAFIFSSYIKSLIRQHLAEKHITDLNGATDDPKLAAMRRDLQANEEQIKKMGYQEMPENMYEKLLEEHEFKKSQQAKQIPNSKQKRSLFIQ